MHTSTKFLTKAQSKTLVDAALAEYFTTRTQEALVLSPRYEALWRSLHTLVLAGGKRFRPHMLFLAYQAYNEAGRPEDIIPAAVAQELLHSAMLIHDDIIDRDDIRYGVKNIYGQAAERYAPLVASPEERHHFSVSAALLAGDALLSDAHAELQKLTVSADKIALADAILTKAVFEVIGGELIDTEAAILPKGIVMPEQIALHKTASYSFVSPLTMGAALAGAPTEEVELLRSIALKVGLGYQIRDDILGVFGDEAETGKSVSSDITEGKYSALIEQFDQLATAEQKQAFYATFHKADASEEELAQARALLEQSGALEATEALIDELSQTSLSQLKTLTISADAQEALQACITECLNRNA